MVSNTQQTERIRARRHKNAGQRRKRWARAHGTPAFPIHQPGYDPNAPDAPNAKAHKPPSGDA
jgi:hypothetical protein